MKCVERCKLVVVEQAGAYSDYGTRKVHRFAWQIDGGRWIIMDISRGSIDMGIIQ
jgi:hypothetical protein